MPPRKVTKADLMFPADVSEWLPPWGSIPLEFKSYDNRFVKLASEAWATGLSKEKMIAEFEIRSSVSSQEEAQERLNQIQVCLGSFAPMHEHKIAGVAYLLFQLFEPKSSVTTEKNGSLKEAGYG